MFRSFFKKKHSEKTLSVIQAGFPAWLSSDVLAVMTQISPTETEPHVDPAHCFSTVDGPVTIPSRVYFPETSEVQGFTQNQMTILAAIMTCHHSGYHREAAVRSLMSHPDTWTTPFVATLLGDYVKEILSTIDSGLTPEWNPFFHDFAEKNPKWLRPLSHRILTYWDIYYRRSFPRITDYPGYTVSQRLGLWDKKAAPKLMKKLTKRSSESR